MKQEKVYVGVDVAKAYLDVAWQKQSHHVSNSAAGRSELLAWLRQITGHVHVICEASGGYERPLVQALQRWRRERESGAGEPGAAVCTGLWHFSQNRFD
jgi:hypothetical protein